MSILPAHRTHLDLIIHHPKATQLGCNTVFLRVLQIPQQSDFLPCGIGV